MTEPGSTLARARAAFDQGNFAEVRRLVGPLLSSLPSGSERDEAEELWSRIQPDPWMSYLLALSLLLLLAVTLFAYSSSSP